jgi:hypothetical protein
MTDQFAAGWYPDPSGTPRLRYFDGHAWTEHYAALAPAAWAPPQTSNAPIERQKRGSWKRKRVLIPAAVIAIGVINVANTPRSNRVATSPATTIATQVLAAEVTSTVSPSSSSTAVTSTTVAAPASTVAPTIAAPTTAKPAVTEPPRVLPIAAPVDTEPAAAAPETSPAATTAGTSPASTAPGTSVYFKNCAEARAAGAAPLHRGDPGYRAALDKDNDGIACE